MAKDNKNKRKKDKRNITEGVVHISASFNNTIVSVSDLQGNVFSWSSTGIHGFKGARKSTPYAARMASTDAIEKAMEYGLNQVSIKVAGPGAGRESAMRAVAASGVKIISIEDRTPVPHNGCRAPKRRRV